MFGVHDGQLLVVDPSQRPGCDSQGSLAIRQHSWFQVVTMVVAAGVGVEVEVVSCSKGC